MKESKKILLFLVISFLFVSQILAVERIDSKYIIRTFIDEEGNSIDEIIVPGRPPEHHREPVVKLPDPATSDAINILSNVPAFDWCYGCSATSAAMIAGYYDNGSYSNMYTGPANGGVVPMNNSTWGSGECPLSATHQGYDGLTVKGHADDYWSDYGSTVDPYYGNWTEHGYEDCTADYMGTNQYQNWQNTDGSTTFYYYSNGASLYDYTACEPAQKDGCHGFKQFIESRGYNIFHDGLNYQNYSQYIYGYNGNTLGFTYDQFKTEIDAGRPVIIQVSGHSMVGFGYDDSSNLVYIHDTWDHSDHTMTWGGSYSGMAQYGVGVFVLEDAANPVIAVTPMSFSSTLEFDQTEEHNMYITNAGDPGSILNYSLSHDYTGEMDNISGSYVICSPNTYTAGETSTLTFTVYNASTDVEWLTDIYIDFPPGVTVNSGTDFVGGHYDLVYDGTTGDGAYLHWYDGNGGYGNIYGGETATATVNVSIDSGFAGEMPLDYQIIGDDWGSAPHVVNGSMTLYEANWLSYSPTSGSCNYNETDMIDVTFNSTGLPVGTYTADILVTNNGGGPVTVPCTLTIIDPPDIEASPTSFTENLNTGDTSTQILTIYNHGGENLDVSLHIEETTDFGNINITSVVNRTNNKDSISDRSSRTGQHNIIIQNGHPQAFDEMISQIDRSSLIFADDMESGTNGWTTQLYGGTTDDLWHQSHLYYNSENTSWWCGIEGVVNYNTGNTINTAMISPSIDLNVSSDQAILYFYENYDTEPNYDFCMVDITIDGGINWIPLRGNYGSAPSGSSGGWILSSLDLSPYIGNIVQIRFYFDTGDAIGNSFVGWFMDDVIVTTDNPNISWLALDHHTDTIAPYDSYEEFLVEFDAASMIHGTYTANIVIDSNDPHNPQVIVPVTLTVNNNPPTIVLPDDLTFAEDGSLIVDFATYIDDFDGDQLILSVSGNTNVVVNIAGSVVTFGAVQDWFGTETLTFTVNDGQARATASDNVDVIVTPVNDPPVLNITGTFEADEDLPSQTY
ncbi:MAG: C39 family peptidase, partial [Candidatus Cloacimonetes bacterium]|nr:C39 family peptidase [Candidatus Cloacimonadota bacterium]